MSLTANQLIKGYYSSYSNEVAKLKPESNTFRITLEERTTNENRGFNEQGIDSTKVLGTSL